MGGMERRRGKWAGGYGGFPVLPDRLRQARSQAGLTQEQAAASVGVIRQAWGQWEAGRATPIRAAGELLAVCNLLRADPAWLLGLTDIRRPWPPPAVDRDGAAPMGAAVAVEPLAEPPRLEDAARGLDETRRLMLEAVRALEAARVALWNGPPRPQP
jgi:DNA-binding XRE family transcriptional regulator